jgi:hypothetical protein
MGQKTKRAAPPPPDTLMRRVNAQQVAVFADMAALSKKYGADVFRTAGQRYFKQQREEGALQREIAEREAELQRLRQKTARTSVR